MDEEDEKVPTSYSIYDPIILCLIISQNRYKLITCHNISGRVSKSIFSRYLHHAEVKKPWYICLKQVPF
jgi:hypothetical protein